MTIKTLLATGILSMGLAGSALAGDISVSNAWSRASMGMARAGVAFLTLKNSGKVDDKLVSASADISKKVELHTHLMDNGIMRMRQVKSIDVPAGATTQLKPGGLHIMFIGLKAPLKKGGSFPLTLNFEKSGSVKTTVTVHGGGAMYMDHSKMKMDGSKMKKMDMK